MVVHCSICRVTDLFRAASTLGDDGLHARHREFKHARKWCSAWLHSSLQVSRLGYLFFFFLLRLPLLPSTCTWLPLHLPVSASRKPQSALQ